jgi:hypothetical protein
VTLAWLITWEVPDDSVATHPHLVGRCYVASWRLGDRSIEKIMQDIYVYERTTPAEQMHFAEKGFPPRCRARPLAPPVGVATPAPGRITCGADGPILLARRVYDLRVINPRDRTVRGLRWTEQTRPHA